MRAAVMHGRGDLRIEEVPVPDARDGELLLEVSTVGVCGTDASEWAHGPALFPIEAPHPVTGHHGPMILGHEFSGIVVDVGAAVDRSWIGRLVASCGSIACGECDRCRSGRSNLCVGYAAVGLHRDGALARYVSTPVGNCLEVGSLGIDPHEAALVQPMAIAVHAIERSRVRHDNVAVVQGVGGIGAFLVHALHDAGIAVVAVDLDPRRLELATELGTQATIRAGEPDVEAAINAEVGDRIPVFFEVTGSGPGLEVALRVVPMGATVVLVGIQKAPRTIDLARVTTREIDLIGTNALVRETDFPAGARLVARRRGGWGALAPPPLPLEDVVEGALRPMAEGRPPAVKTCIRPYA